MSRATVDPADRTVGWKKTPKCRHTPEPAGLGYLGWFDWCEHMAKTHVQKQCPGCGRWAIWEKKRTRARPTAAEAPTNKSDAKAKPKRNNPRNPA